MEAEATKLLAEAKGEIDAINQRLEEIQDTMEPLLEERKRLRKDLNRMKRLRATGMRWMARRLRAKARPG